MIIILLTWVNFRRESDWDEERESERDKWCLLYIELGITIAHLFIY